MFQLDVVMRLTVRRNHADRWTSHAGWRVLSDLAKKLKHASAMVGMAATLVFSGQAHAVQFVGEWDPAFGSPFTSLGWKGSAVFEIPDLCLANDGTYVNGVGCAAGFGLKMITAQVDFYNLADESTILDTLYFAAPSATLTMEVTNNTLTGVIGLFLTPDRSTLNIAGGNTDFWLGFVKSNGDYFAQLAFKQYGTCGSFFHFPCVVDTGLSQLTADSNGGRPFMTFTQVGLEVPEPGSLALMLPALGLLALVRRRKSAVA